MIWDPDPGIRQAVAIWIDATKEKQCAIHVVQQSLAGWWPNRKKIHRNSRNYLQESFHWIFKSCSFTDFKIFKLAQGLTKTRLSQLVNPLGFSPLLSKWIAAPWNSGIALQLRRFTIFPTIRSSSFQIFQLSQYLTTWVFRLVKYILRLHLLCIFGGLPCLSKRRTRQHGKRREGNVPWLFWVSNQKDVTNETKTQKHVQSLRA